MILIKRIKNILFFILAVLLILYLLKLSGVSSFIFGFIRCLFPIFIALFISICLEGIISKFIKKGYKRKCVTIFTYIALILILVIFLIIFIPPFINQIQIFIRTLPYLIEEIENLLKSINITFNFNSILDSLQIKLDKLIEYFTSGFSIFIDIGIGFSGAFFISYDFDKIKEKSKKLIPSIIKKETLYFFSKYIPFFSKYMYSLLIDSIITFVISFSLFMIFRVEYSLIGALIITITNLIPFIGPLLGIIPLVIIGYSVSNYFAIISLVIVLIVQFVESNIMQPIIFNNVIKLHPLEGIIGVLIFSYLFGAVGMILSPLLVVAFKILFVEKYDKTTSHILE